MIKYETVNEFFKAVYDKDLTLLESTVDEAIQGIEYGKKKVKILETPDPDGEHIISLFLVKKDYMPFLQTALKKLQEEEHYEKCALIRDTLKTYFNI